ncbi:pro-sigmaK processing inhibitor BofA family protein [Caldanaerobius polysaccharolyticus]|uniref:pro-sigmaK processing inhibitor BofA family protein n=1 Tax=Caldanaerobius polysaccharolyticus TaxID=44256 RepID=UPI00047B03AE|nr:pro-sigmaK processing inhibitor BofA family protein [Caldanaerobius polysaccharolyticus]
MNLGIEFNTIFGYILGLGILFLLGWVLIVPIKILLKLIFNTIIGGILLYILNVFGSFTGLSIALNPVTAVVAGLLGVPGIAMMVLLKKMLL